MKEKYKKLRSPIIWLGGKGLNGTKILKLMPPHEIYIEVFGGGASLLFMKEPVGLEVYNDLDSGLTDFFKVIRTPELFAPFYHNVMHIPYSREVYNEFRHEWKTEKDLISRVAKWYVVVRMSFGGHFGHSWGYGIQAKATSPSRWMSILHMLPVIHERMMKVQVENDTWENTLKRYDNPAALIYLDPPYVPATRKSGTYKHELDDADHKKLVKTILKHPSIIMLSGYANELYSPLEDAGWNRVDFETVCGVAGHTRHNKNKGKGASKKSQPRVESVWRNPAAMKALEATA